MSKNQYKQSKLSFCISYILPLLSTTGLHLVLYRLHTQHREYDCSFMLPEIILFPPTSIGHAHVSSHSHRSPQALNNKSKVKFIKWKKEARSLHSWLVDVSTSVLKEDIMSSYHHRDSLVGAEQNLSVEKTMLPTKPSFRHSSCTSS